MFESLFKAAVGVALLPVAAAVDVITLPAIAMDDRKSTTVKFLQAIEQNIEDVVEPE